MVGSSRIVLKFLKITRDPTNEVCPSCEGSFISRGLFGAPNDYRGRAGFSLATRDLCRILGKNQGHLAIAAGKPSKWPSSDSDNAHTIGSWPL